MISPNLPNGQVPLPAGTNTGIIATLEEETITIAQDLLRIDTSNFGGVDGANERPAADYILGKLIEAGYREEEIQLIESAPGRASVILRIPGTNRDRGALIVHGHTDVVPAKAEDWSVDPFGGVIKDGMLYGRGSVDMKGMDAMMLANVRAFARAGLRPQRDLIIAFLADEEAGGKWGAHWLVDNRPDVFEGATEAISEVGGYSVDVNGRHVFLIQTAEKGLGWLRLTAEGRAGHGSQVNPSNAVTMLASAMSRIGEYEWDLDLTPTVRALLAGVSELTGLPFDEDDEESINALVDALGPAKRYVGATLRTGASPTQLHGGYMSNVIPQTAYGTIDVRPIPGTEDAVYAKIQELAGPGIKIEAEHKDQGFEVPFDCALVDAMKSALDAEDNGAVVLPYMLSAGTDNKGLGRMGIKGYGFVPLLLPEGFDFPAMFHGVDERVPVESLKFGARVLHRLMLQC